MSPRARRPAVIDPFQPSQIKRLVREFGSPLLIVDCERVRVQLRKLRRALPHVDLHYALKPLPHPAVVRTIVAEGGYLDLATTGEVQLAQRLGVDPQRCIHTHPIKREQDIRNALAFGVCVFVADNPDEVRKFAHLTDRTELLLRVSFRSPGAVLFALLLFIQFGNEWSIAGWLPLFLIRRSWGPLPTSGRTQQPSPDSRSGIGARKRPDQPICHPYSHAGLRVLDIGN